MRVVHLVAALFGNEGIFGGAERYAYELARAMARHVPTTLLAFGKKPFRRRDGDLQVEVIRNWVPYRRLRFDPFTPTLPLWLGKFTHFHFHQTPSMMADLSLVTAKLSGRRMFGTHHGGAGMGLHRLINVKPWYDGLLHVSEWARSKFGDADAPNAAVVSGGVDTEKFSPDPAVTERREILYAGRLLPHKGIDYLIDAVTDATPLRILGRPARHAMGYYEVLRRKAAGKPVVFEENASDGDLVQAYRRAKCIVLPSVYRSSDGGTHSVPELLGQTLLEGMACGAPAICTRVGGMPEVVEDGVTGFVVEPNSPEQLREKILRLHTDRAGAAEMGRAARARMVRLFSWDAVVGRCLQAYTGTRK